MKKATIVIVSLVLGVTLLGFSTGYAAGYPVAAIGTSTDTSIIVIGKFDPASFSQVEAQNISSTIFGALSGILGSLGSGSNTTLLTPDQLSGYGIADADYLKTLVKDNYIALGFDIFVFLDIKRTNPVSQVSGPNIRIDVWVADKASLFELTGDYLYAASVEAPEMYLSLLQSL